MTEKTRLIDEIRKIQKTARPKDLETQSTMRLRDYLKHLKKHFRPKRPAKRLKKEDLKESV